MDGLPAVVLSTTQILTGKLHRWGEAALRDAIDFNHAARRDRDSLTFAVNTLSSIETEARKQKFRLAAGRFATTDDPLIRRMDRKHQPALSTLGQAAADTIHGLRYAEVGITVQSGVCHFEATTHSKHSIHLRCRENQVDMTFATFGINEYLHTTLKDPGKVQNEVRHACRHTWRKHPPILRETHAAPPLTNEPDESGDDAPGGKNANADEPRRRGAASEPRTNTVAGSGSRDPIEVRPAHAGMNAAKPRKSGDGPEWVGIDQTFRRASPHTRGLPVRPTSAVPSPGPRSAGSARSRSSRRRG